MIEVSAFDYGIAVFAFLSATAFYFLRRRLHVENVSEQWLSDVFNVGTLVILADLLLLPLTHNRGVLPDAWGEAMRRAATTNGIIVLAAFGNCIRVVGAGLLRSFRART